ncbi:hypothetical protein [Streptomyces sp. NPDC127108]|uniref:hypothetical protein n=1 Tax=Streptomyces sp. NPDC127108 TaxID=3345361 RepID=UPI00362E99F9
MCRTSEPDDPGTDTEGDEPPAADPGTSTRWQPRKVGSWWTGLRAVLLVMDTVAALAQHEALALGARALIAVGDMIVDAGKHERS